MAYRLKNRAAADVVLIVTGITVVFIIPEFASIPTGCLFNKTTGFYCAGCGMSRGIHAILRGDYIHAMHENLLLVSALPLSGLWFIFRFFPLKNSSIIKKHDKAVILFFILIVIIFMILRNIPSVYFSFLRPA